jgi:HORMA domain
MIQLHVIASCNVDETECELDCNALMHTFPSSLSLSLSLCLSLSLHVYCNIMATVSVAYSDGHAQDVTVTASKQNGMHGDKERTGQAKLLDRSVAKRATITTIRNLVQMTSTLNPLPRRRYFTMRLKYNDDAPDDYEPQFFRAAKDADMLAMQFASRPESYQIGHVETPYHAVKLGIRTIADELDSESEEVTSSENGMSQDPNMGSQMSNISNAVEANDNRNGCARDRNRK